MNFQFDEQFKMAEDDEVQSAIFTFIRQNITGVSFIERAGKNDDKHGTDYWVHLNSGKTISIDVKVRGEDYTLKDPPQDDLALELWSVKGAKVGWTRDENKATDFVLWHWKDSHRFCMISFPQLCSAFQENYEEWLSKYQDMIRTQTTVNKDQSTYRSQCIYIPRAVVLRAIQEKFMGRTAA